jgi:heme/copper-type cytochrome/quinol oxidase subunit 2
VSRAAIRTLILVLVLLLVLAGLFFLLRPESPAPESSTGDSTTSESTSEGPQEETFDLAVEGGAMTPDEITAYEGDRVTFRITSDQPLEFHLHGYEIEQEIEPNEPTELQFDATITGRFPIEDHNSDTELGMLLVQPR